MAQFEFFHAEWLNYDRTVKPASEKKKPFASKVKILNPSSSGTHASMA